MFPQLPAWGSLGPLTWGALVSTRVPGQPADTHCSLSWGSVTGDLEGTDPLKLTQLGWRMGSPASGLEPREEQKKHLELVKLSSVV